MYIIMSTKSIGIKNEILCGSEKKNIFFQR